MMKSMMDDVQVVNLGPGGKETRLVKLLKNVSGDLPPSDPLPPAAALRAFLALFRGRPVTILCTEKGRAIGQKIKRNFGMPHPEGYRKALRLMEQAVKWGRHTRPGMKVGICGEHGGHPASIRFCHQIGLSYVSCSGPRVPIARLAAAQAAILVKRRSEPDISA